MRGALTIEYPHTASRQIPTKITAAGNSLRTPPAAALAPGADGSIIQRRACMKIGVNGLSRISQRNWCGTMSMV